MNLPYDPAGNDRFWGAIRGLPGYPVDEYIPLRQMIFESGALFRLPEVLSELAPDAPHRVQLVMDPTPMRRGNASLKPLLVQVLRKNGWEPEVLALAPDASGQVHTDMKHIQAVRRWLEPEIPVISVGSGVVTDVTKHACFLFEQQSGIHLPLVAYQTANSVIAYTSNSAPVFVEGVKRTLASRYPDALVCDLETLRDAPPEMTAAGVGDLLAVFSSFPDWHLAHRLGMDPGYNPLPRALMGDLEAILTGWADDVRARTLAGMAGLAKLVTLGGLAMSLAGTTAPLSGYEHAISHLLDLLNEQRSRPLALHGSQVALATRLACRAYRIFLDEFEPQAVDLDACFPTAERMQEHILEIFARIDPSGKAGAECWAGYQPKLEGWHDQRQSLQGFLTDWQTIRGELDALSHPAQSVDAILQGVGAAQDFDELSPPVSEAEAKFAFLVAPLTRRRLTLGDLLIFTGWDREALWRRIWYNKNQT